MRFYSGIQECHDEIKRDLKEMGVKYISKTVQDKKEPALTYELRNYDYTLLSPDYFTLFDFATDHGVDDLWLEAEMSDRINLTLKDKNPNPGPLTNMGFWKHFMRDGCFSYTYPERLHPQIERIIHELKANPSTRHAVLTVYDQHQDLMNLGGRDRVPCSMYYQFLLRGGHLHCSYTMRSCDFIKFFLADMVMAVGLQRYITSRINATVGHFTHFIGSLHAFEKDLEGVF